MNASVIIRKKVFNQKQSLTPVFVLYPLTNKKEAAMLDEDNKLVGFSSDHVYHSTGGMASIKSITDTGCLADGSSYFGYDCLPVGDNVYTLEYSSAA